MSFLIELPGGKVPLEGERWQAYSWVRSQRGGDNPRGRHALAIPLRGVEGGGSGKKPTLFL